MGEEIEFRFAPGQESAPGLQDDPKLALMAVCVAIQQSAGFGEHIDIREFSCPGCGAPGFNTGFGFWRFTCGAELLTDPDGTWDIPCPKGEESEEMRAVLARARAESDDDQ